MNLILLHPSDQIDSGAYRVRDRRADHIREVLRPQVGASLRVGLLDGPLGWGDVAEIAADGVTLRCRFESMVPPRAPVDLIVGIPRPKSLRKLLPEIATMGVDRVVLLRTWRVAKPYLRARC